MQLYKTYDTMIDRITDSMPVLGGAGGAFCGAEKMLAIIPSIDVWAAIGSTVVYMFAGATIGYLVKLLLDWAIKKIKNKIFKK